MKNLLFTLLVFVMIFLFGCDGGGQPQNPVDPPRDPETVYPNPVGNDSWKKYVREDSRHEYVTIDDQDKDETSFTISWGGTIYLGYFTWSSSDGKTVDASLIYESSTNLPRTAKIYNYNDTRNSYIMFNGYKYYFVGYVT